MNTAEQALATYRPEGNPHPNRPTKLAWKTFTYLFKQKFIHTKSAFRW